jgi:hypothetical protein
MEVKMKITRSPTTQNSKNERDTKTHVYQFREFKKLDTGKSPSLDHLAALINHTRAQNGCLSPQDALNLATAAENAIEALFSDILLAGMEAFQEAMLEAFQANGNV